MALPDDVEVKLSNEGIVEGSTGWPLYANAFPPDSDRAVVVTIIPSGGPDHEGATDEVEFQVKTRAERGAGRAAFDKLIDVFKSLHKFEGTMNGVDYGGIFTDTYPAFLRIDGNERHEYVANFRALRQGPR